MSLADLEKMIAREYFSDEQEQLLKTDQAEFPPTLEQLLQKGPQPHTNKIVSL